MPRTKRNFPHLSKACQYCVIGWFDSAPEVGILVKSDRNCHQFLILNAPEKVREGCVEYIDTPRQVLFVGSLVDAYSYQQNHFLFRLS